MIQKCSWNTGSASEQELQLFFILSCLYEKHENLLHRLLNPDIPRLINPELSSEERAHGLSSGEYLLLRIGLDIWNGSGGMHFNELYEKLDMDSLQKVIMAIIFLRAPGRAHLF